MLEQEYATPTCVAYRAQTPEAVEKPPTGPRGLREDKNPSSSRVYRAMMQVFTLLQDEIVRLQHRTSSESFASDACRSMLLTMNITEVSVT